MDRLISTASWYNPLSVLVNHGWREIEDIVFYRKTGEEYHVGRGWFGGNSNLKEGEFIDVPSVSLRRKIRFDGEAFAVSVKKSCLGEKKKRMVLYLPFEFFEFEFLPFLNRLNNIANSHNSRGTAPQPNLWITGADGKFDFSLLMPLAFTIAVGCKLIPCLGIDV